MALGPVSAGPPQPLPDSRLSALDVLLAVLMCVLAFLLASTPARNSDLWLHLASGRLSPDGTDPFSSTTQGVFWVNHSWLSDLLLYRIHQFGGGTALVVGKAVLVVLLAALLSCFRRRGEGTALFAVAGFAALLALGPWLLLQPILWSLLGVVLTLYLLERRSRARWLLVPLFALWANLDGWFVLGPVLVGLYAVGSDKRFFLLFFAGLAACLATPYHYHIFAWPTPLGLTPTEQALRHDPLGQTLIISPFSARFADSPIFRSPGAWAYYFLLAASAASFVLSMRTLHVGRLLAWLFLAALSIYQARTIPFFTVTAAALLMLNVRQGRPLLAPRAGKHWGAGAAVLVGIVLLVLAWPGWLQPAPYQPRGWTAEPDDSLVRLAEQLNRWHAEARWRPDRFALTFNPEVAHHLAWLCPAEKGFVDSRWPLFDGVADDYVRMRRCLLQEGGAEVDRELMALLDAHRIDRILLHDSDAKQIERAYRHLFLATSEWELLAVEGGATVFRRRGAAPSVAAFDSRRAVYHPALNRRAPPAPRSPRPPGWFDAFLRRADNRSADREEAALHLLSFKLQTEQQQRRVVRQWLLGQATGLLGCGWGREPAGTAAMLALRLALTQTLQEYGPSAPLILAVRAARRALAVNPDDAGAWLLLGEAYFRLDRQTRERDMQMMLGDLAPLRQAQMLTALEQAALLRPDLALAHDLLAQLYFEAGQMDRCLDHLRAQLRIAERSAEQRAALRPTVENMEKLVSQSEKTYQTNVAGKTDPSKVLERAQVAARHGLSRKALELLLNSYPAIFGRAGVEYELDLMLQAGQSYEIRDWLEPKHEGQIDVAVYHWVKARAAASCGDYAEADAQLDKDDEPLRRTPVRSIAAFQVAGAVLARPLAAQSTATLATALDLQFEALRPLESLAGLLRQQADRQVLRGMLAVEAGDMAMARRHFRAALDLWGEEGTAAAGGGLDFAARPIAQEQLRRLQE